MDVAPSEEQLKSLIVSIREKQENIRKVVGPPKKFQQSLAASLEPLKTPIYVLRQLLGYADFPQSWVQHQWLASFKSSPSDFLYECIVQIKNGDIPVDDLRKIGTVLLM